MAIQEMVLKKIKKVKKVSFSWFSLVFSKVRQLPKKAKNILIRGYRLFDDFIFEKYMGNRMLKRFVIVTAYLILMGGVIVAGLLMSEKEWGGKIIHLDDGNNIVIGVSTILLTMFVPIAILLIDDARQSALQRQIIVRNVIQLKVTLAVVSLLCFCLLLPKDIILVENYTLKSLSASIIIASWIYIIHIFLNAYNWLADGSESAEGYNERPGKDEPIPEAFTSYRFIQKLRYLTEADSHDAWFHLWRKWYPPAYEKELHNAFFVRQSRILEGRQTKKYEMISLEAQAYGKYMLSQRSISDDRYGHLYLEGFLGLHRLYSDEKRRVGPLFSDNKSLVDIYSSLASGVNVISGITREFIEKNTNPNGAWITSTIMAEHARKINLQTNKRGELVSDPMIRFFLGILFERLWNGSIELDFILDFQNQNGEWGVTIENFEDRQNLPALELIREFTGWIEKKFDERDYGKPFGISNVIRFVFPEAASSAMAKLYWFRHTALRKLDASEAVQEYANQQKFFELEDNVFGQPSEEVEALEKKSVELFLRLYNYHFAGSNTIENLVIAAENLANRSAPQERHILDEIIKLLRYGL